MSDPVFHLPADAPRDKRLYLIGDGFLQPTDGSINIAYGQTGQPPPQGLSIETPDAQGNWTTAKSGLGFPAGKLKTVVLDLNNIFRPGAPRRRHRVRALQHDRPPRRLLRVGCPEPRAARRTRPGDARGRLRADRDRQPLTTKRAGQRFGGKAARIVFRLVIARALYAF